jgi:hypothetical protein
MAHTFCCIKPPVALVHFIVDCISQLNFYNESKVKVMTLQTRIHPQIFTAHSTKRIYAYPSLWYS